MSNARFLEKKRNAFLKLWGAAKSCRHQIGMVAVAATLGLVIILNVAMAPETEMSPQAYHMTYFKEKAPQDTSVIR